MSEFTRYSDPEVPLTKDSAAQADTYTAVHALYATHRRTQKLEADVIDLDTGVDAARQAPRTLSLALAPDGITSASSMVGFGKMPVPGTVISVEFVAANVATGDGAVGGTLLGAGNSLLAADVDLKAGIADTLKAGTLTATVAHLTLEAGDLLKAAAVAAGTQGDADGLTCIVTFIPA